MNKVTRMLAMTGMALAASATIGMGAASAAPAAPATPSADSAKVSVTKSPDKRFGKSKVIGYYSNPFTCHKIGNLGEWKNRWDSHRCSKVRGPFHRKWVLVAYWDKKHHGFPGNWDNNNHGGGHGGHDGHGGQGGHDFPGNGPWDQKNR